MAPSRRLLTIVATASLLVASLGTSVAAIVIPEHVAVVQGIPGVRVDLCIDGKEIRSNVRYGWQTVREISPGTHKLKVFKQSPGKCKGVKLAQKSFVAPGAGDVSLVVKRGTPKVLVFDNTSLPPIGTAVHQATFVMRHGAKAGPLDLYAGFGSQLAPTAAFVTGDQIVSTTVAAGSYFALWATKASSPEPRFGPKTLLVEGDHRYEIYLLGSKPRNYKIVIMDRPYLFGHL